MNKKLSRVDLSKLIPKIGCIDPTSDLELVLVRHYSYREKYLTIHKTNSDILRLVIGNSDTTKQHRLYSIYNQTRYNHSITEFLTLLEYVLFNTVNEASGFFDNIVFSKIVTNTDTELIVEFEVSYYD